ncbi:MAG: hypothetical protein P8163_18210 [Candidatus Thiodiazotropha sp.]
MLTACGGGDSNDSAASDTVPDVYTFTDQSNVALSTIITSDSIIITGIDATTTISVTDGEYSIDDGAFTTTAGSVTNGQAVRVRHLSSSLSSTTTTTLLRVGGVTGTFTSTTGASGIGFNKARSFNDSVDVISPATDGSGDLYVGGDFTTYNRTSSNRLIRLNSDGTVDSAFNVGSGFDAWVYSISPIDDGSGDLYVGGAFTTYNGAGRRRLIRLNSDGTVDTSFNVGVGFDSVVTSISPANDGSGDLYVAGWFTAYGSTKSSHVIRLNSDGSVDTEFDVKGVFDDFVASISLATDGSGDLYVGGRFTTYNGTSSNRLLRLNSDGTVDTAFNVGGGFDSDVDYIVPTMDGSGDLYVGGLFSTYNGTDSNRLIRLNSDGSVDTTLNVGSGFDFTVYSINPATDGSGVLYVGGWFDTYNGTGSTGLIRLNSDGTVDTAFNIGSGFDDVVVSVSLATDGSGDLYVGGHFTAYNGTGRNRLIRLNSDGTADAAFSFEGSGFDYTVNSIVPATDGSGDLYVGGEFLLYNGTDSNGVMRLNEDGTVDEAFNVDSDAVYHAKCISPTTDGSGDLYVGGWFATSSTGSKGLIRLNNDGTVDERFHLGNGFGDVNVKSISLATDGSGDLYVGGGGYNTFHSSGSKGLIRINGDGTVDTAFDVGSGFDDLVMTISQATDGSGDIYVGGAFSTYNGTSVNGLIRLNNDGTVDTAFNVGSGFDYSASDILDYMIGSISPAVDGSGDLYVGGRFNTYNGIGSNGLIRLNSDGTVDTALNVDGGFDYTPGVSVDYLVYSISPLTDGSGDLYVGGMFNLYNGISSNRLIRLNSDGTVDEAFDVGSGFDDFVKIVSQATDGSGALYVGGGFNSYQSTTVGKIVRLKSDGSLD